MKDEDRKIIERLHSHDRGFTEITFYVTDKNAEAFANALIGNTSIQKLNLRSDYVTNETLALVADGLEFNRGVSDLRLSSGFDKCGIKILSRGIIANPTVAHLAIDFHTIDDEYAGRVAEIVKENKNLRVLYLRRVERRSESELLNEEVLDAMQAMMDPGKVRPTTSYISEKGIETLATAIKRHGMLAQFHLINTPLSPLNAEHIADIVKENAKLETLNLQGCNLMDDSVKSIAEAFKVNNHITFLCLSGNKIGDQGASYIAGALVKNNKLRVLDLDENKINVLGAQKISEALPFNFSLRGLQLNGNLLQDEGVRFIVEKLTFNKTIQFLSISRVSCGPPGAKIIGELLKRNDTLQALCFGANSVNRVGLQSIAEGLEKNNYLSFLTLSDINFSDSTLKAIARALEKNTTLSTLSLTQKEAWLPHQLQYLRHALEKNIRLVNLQCHSQSVPDKTVEQSHEMKQIEGFLAHNKLNRIKIVALLFKAFSQSEQVAAGRKFLGKDVLIKILSLVYPELTPKTFQRLRHSHFFTAGKSDVKERTLPAMIAPLRGCSIM